MFWHSRVGCSLPFLIHVVIGLMIHQQVLPWQGENKKNAELFRIQRFCGGEDATRTHNALRHTTFPMWLLTIRIPLRVALDYYSKHFSKKQEEIFIFLKKFFAPAKRGAGGPPILSGWGGRGCFGGDFMLNPCKIPEKPVKTWEAGLNIPRDFGIIKT